MAITDNVLPTALFYCCDTNLRTDIMRDLQGDVASMIETDLLKAIKRLAVKEESTLVQRIKLNRMTQSPGSNIRTFLASLIGQASLCQYKATCKELGCNHIFDYSDEIIKDNLVRGIADPEIIETLITLVNIHTNVPNVSTVTSPKIAASMENSEEVTCSCPRPPPSPPPVPTILPPDNDKGDERRCSSFYPARMTCLATDWSVDGVGFFLMQKYCQCSNKTHTCCNDGLKLCLVGSRCTYPAESRHRQQTTPQPQRPGYRCTIIHVPGRNNLEPDAAARYHVGPPDRLNLPSDAPELDSLVNMTSHYHNTFPSICLHTEDNNTANDTSTVAAATCALNAVIIVVTWNMVREATASDSTFVNLIRQLEVGFPEDCKELPTDLCLYHRSASSLCTVDGVVLMGKQIIIQPAHRKPVFNALRAVHQ
ncbi:unnamed protein product [Mytilus edulis]|uniref:Uncharacterized protein n=1 Tax=Mytilus edulis TaxID=6550 RepID=A0A8S3V7I2_MYTED|nr:unnamed protein product [Mytilus edulis]